MANKENDQKKDSNQQKWQVLTVISNFALAVATFVLAWFAYENTRLTKESVNLTMEGIKLTKDIYVGTNRPWLDFRLIDTRIDDVNKQIYVTLKLEAVSTSSPARFVSCAHWAKQPEGSGPNGGGVTLSTSVLLPHESIPTEPLVSLEGKEYFVAVFESGKEARYEVQCWYSMEEEIPKQFYTKKVFILNERQYKDRQYHEQPQLTEMH